MALVDTPMAVRSRYIDIVENQYFGNMALGKPELILPLLSEDAVLTGFFGTNAPRVVKHVAGPGEESFVHFLSALKADFTLHYSDFIHFVDVEAERCACTFRLDVIPRDPASTVGIRRLRNCNFFQFDRGLIRAVTAYFAAPSAVT